MSSINSVRKLQILCFSKKNKKIKNLKKWRKKVAQNPHLYMLLLHSIYYNKKILL